MKKLSLFLAANIITISIAFSQGTAINTTGAKADSSAILDLGSTSKGILLPRMTTAERNSIVNPALSLQIYNTTTNCFEFYAFGIWHNLACASCPSVSAPSEGTHDAQATQIEWKWNSVGGATGYKWNTIDDYNSATDMGTNLTNTETGLNCNTAYTRYVWAYNGCTNSDVTMLEESTLNCPWSCGQSMIISHSAGVNGAPDTKTVTYGTVLTDIAGTGDKCWITQNLGADVQAASAMDGTDAAAGWYWQFNRMQGYKPGPSPAWTITSINEDSDWQPAIDPCTLLLGAGWRLPTNQEWINADGPPQNWGNPTDLFNSILKIHVAGFMEASNGSMNCRSWCGFYWSSEQSDNTNANTIYSDPGNCFPRTYNKAYGYTIRCLK